jgi:hypothetical protein
MTGELIQWTSGLEVEYTVNSCFLYVENEYIINVVKLL